MSSKRLMLLMAVSFACLAATAVPARTDAETDAPTEELTSRIKSISISFSGGYYSGTRYLDLPIIDDRAQLAEGSNTVTLFNGEELDLGTERPANGFDAPVKEIDAGEIYRLNIGFYLSDSFHFDLNASYSRAKATLSMARFENDLFIERVYGEDLDQWYEGFYDETRFKGGSEDSNFKSYMGGISLAYDAHTLKTFGLRPYFGTGFGGIINRFSVLEDKTALYFQLFGGLILPLSEGFHVNAQFTATTFALQTEEVTYSKQVTTMTGTIGITMLFDVKPIY
ncbi:hypothetical protein KKG45_13905 [bacterium]|nr:hypothetical protein [bacterium]MBU1074333.1 hypothetical protein [bacterium]MBU1675013.1 hypothetical protein [bacterium]